VRRYTFRLEARGVLDDALPPSTTNALDRRRLTSKHGSDSAVDLVAGHYPANAQHNLKRHHDSHVLAKQIGSLLLAKRNERFDRSRRLTDQCRKLANLAPVIRRECRRAFEQHFFGDFSRHQFSAGVEHALEDIGYVAATFDGACRVPAAQLVSIIQ
jgi:hypothetical protein